MRDASVVRPLEVRRIAGLIPYARNARTHSEAQVAQIADSIREFGFTNPVLIDEAGGIIAGHGRVLAAQRLAMAEVPCIVLSGLTSAQKRAYVLADNKLALNAGWDEDLLRSELEALLADGFDLGITGFSGEDLASLNLVATRGSRDPDLAPPLQAAARARPGDVFALGRHLVGCGDSTDHGFVKALVGAEPIDAVWTDPPYNVAYDTGPRGKGRKIANDDLPAAKFRSLLLRAFRGALDVMRPGAPIYVAHSDAEWEAFRGCFRDAGFHLSSCLIWRKSALVLGRSDYQYIHEPILYGWKPGSRHAWYGGRKKTTVLDLQDSPFTERPDGSWQVQVGDRIFVVEGDAMVEEVLPTVLDEARPTRSDDHPTMKPVALIERMLRNSARAGDLIYDAFGGSGSTLIAAERLGMSARLCELEPRYVDVIVRRWQEFAGAQAFRADGIAFDDIEAVEPIPAAA